jgi:hypothetical protein
LSLDDLLAVFVFVATAGDVDPGFSAGVFPDELVEGTVLSDPVEPAFSCRNIGEDDVGSLAFGVL